MKKALIAMSGGIDSSVTAYLMKNSGYDCVGVTFVMFDKADPLFRFSQEDAEKDINDAKSVCDKIGIPLKVIDASADFRKYVINHFVKTYEKGGTPNPCVQCNRYIKFKLLNELACKMQCDVVATGHYAKVIFDEYSGRYAVKKADDPKKDQSYVLYPLTQEQLGRVVFPLGGMTKEQVRQIADENNFVNARKSDSQDICFVHDGDYARLITEITGKTYPCGKFIDTEGNILGKHKGIINYTVGQRRGLELPYGERIYVKEKNPANNTVILSSDAKLYEKEIIAENFNFVGVENLKKPTRCKAKIRYHQPEQNAVAEQIDEQTVKIVFETPQRAPAKGQSAVLYNNGAVLGGGIIK